MIYVHVPTAWSKFSFENCAFKDIIAIEGGGVLTVHYTPSLEASNA